MVHSLLPGVLGSVARRHCAAVIGLTADGLDSPYRKMYTYMNNNHTFIHDWTAFVKTLPSTTRNEGARGMDRETPATAINESRRATDENPDLPPDTSRSRVLRVVVFQQSIEKGERA